MTADPMNADVVNADLLITGIAQLATPTGVGPKFGAQMRELSVLENAAIAITGDRFAWIGPAAEWSGTASRTIDLRGRAVVPGLIDPHTHAVWAGDRLRDFDARTSGVTYEQILASGGGIWSTIRATMSASDEALVSLAEQRVWSLVRSGATVVEVKSGYGFSIAGELRMLEAIRTLAARLPIRIVPTLLIHIPPHEADEREAYLEQVRSELIPQATGRGLAQAVDIFIEKEAWNAAEAESVLTCALDHGLRIKVHAEQFHSVGGVELALRLGALSVDHLEACTARQYGLFPQRPNHGNDSAGSVTAPWYSEGSGTSVDRCRRGGRGGNRSQSGIEPVVLDQRSAWVGDSVEWIDSGGSADGGNGECGPCARGGGCGPHRSWRARRFCCVGVAGLARSRLLHGHESGARGLVQRTLHCAGAGWKCGYPRGT